jgi:predicted kinase
MENYNITMIVGLPGSGKTTLAETMVKDDPKAFLADDFSKNLDKLATLFKKAKFNRVILTDPSLCGVEQRIAEEVVLDMFDLEGEAVDFKWIYFENDPEACLVNAERNPKPGGVQEFIRIRSHAYDIPKDATVLPVYRMTH